MSETVITKSGIRHSVASFADDEIVDGGPMRATITDAFIDAHVGVRLRNRRRALGLSQARLADELALSFQQIQKYERGANRISAPKLYALGRALGVEVTYFFEGLDDGGVQPLMPPQQAVWENLMEAPGGAEIASAYVKIAKPAVRQGISDLIRALAEEEDDR